MVFLAYKHIGGATLSKLLARADKLVAAKYDLLEKLAALDPCNG